GEPDLRWALAVCYARAGRKDQALRIAAEIKKQPSPWADWGLAEVYAVLGDREEALRWLEQGFQDRFSLMPWLRLKDAGLQRPFKPFRNDPRYQDLLRRMNLTD
ncbi:MAG: tetratricopeptide repeat protein, partial [Terriglobales bacterium]